MIVQILCAMISVLIPCFRTVARDEAQIDFAEMIESLTYAHCKTEDVSLPKFGEIFGTSNVSCSTVVVNTSG